MDTHIRHAIGTAMLSMGNKESSAWTDWTLYRSHDGQTSCGEAVEGTPATISAPEQLPLPTVMMLARWYQLQAIKSL